MVISFPPVLLSAQAIQMAECPERGPDFKRPCVFVADDQIVEHLAVLIGHVPVVPVRSLGVQEFLDAGIQDMDAPEVRAAADTMAALKKTTSPITAQDLAVLGCMRPPTEKTVWL